MKLFENIIPKGIAEKAAFLGKLIPFMDKGVMDALMYGRTIKLDIKWENIDGEFVPSNVAISISGPKE